jgi:hypothetical protein
MKVLQYLLEPRINLYDVLWILLSGILIGEDHYIAWILTILIGSTTSAVLQTKFGENVS